MTIQFKNALGTVITSGLDKAKSIIYTEGTNEYILDTSGASPSLKYIDSSSGSSVETDFTGIFLRAFKGSIGDKGPTGDKGPIGDKGTGTGLSDEDLNSKINVSNPHFQENVRAVMSKPVFEIPTDETAPLSWDW